MSHADLPASASSSRSTSNRRPSRSRSISTPSRLPIQEPFAPETPPNHSADAQEREDYFPHFVASPQTTQASLFTSPSLSHSQSQGHRRKKSFTEGKQQHRHSRTVETALELLRTLADEATDRSEEMEEEEGIIANLENRDWVYHGSKEGVRIFSRPEEDTDPHVDREGSYWSGSRGTATDARGKGRRGTGVRTNESLPYFRGEAWIDGDWKVADVAATIRSLGARAVWDPRFDIYKSALVASLSETDSLLHMAIRGAFPVGDRDAALVSTFYEDPEEKLGYIASRSVEDSLIPKLGTRTTIHLNGFCIRSLPQSPHFEQPERPTSPDDAASGPPPAATRPSHRRTQSSISVVPGTPGPAMTPMPLYEPLTNVMPTLTKRTSFTFGNGTNSSAPSLAPLMSPTLHNRNASLGALRIPRPMSLDQVSVEQEVKEVVGEETPPCVGKRPGLHISLIARASPGGNLPQTYVNQLSLSLPLSVAQISRYLTTYGFAPHVCTRQHTGSFFIMEETFDALAGLYKLTYRIASTNKDEATRIRFWGSTFSRGRFEIEILRAKEWKIEYDVEPEESPDVVRQQADDGADTGRHRSSLAIISSPPLATAPLPIINALKESQGSYFDEQGPNQESKKRESVDLASPPSQLPPPRVGALPGPQGGCTLVIPNAQAAGGMPVSVTISKNADRPPAGRMRHISSALAEAAHSSLDAHQYETIDDLLESSHGQGLAEKSLASTREVLRRLRNAREEEQRELAGKVSAVPSVAESLSGLGDDPFSTSSSLGHRMMLKT